MSKHPDQGINFKRSELVRLINAMPELGARSTWNGDMFGLLRMREQTGSSDEAFKYMAAISYGLLTVLLANGALTSDATLRLIELAEAGMAAGERRAVLQEASEILRTDPPKPRNPLADPPDDAE